MTSNALGVLVDREVEMFELASKADRDGLRKRSMQTDRHD